MISDAKKAGSAAKKYFQEVHGWLIVFDFEATEVTHVEQEQYWLVRCSFSTSPMLTAKEAYVTYEVAVADDGRIVSVRKLAPI